MRRYILIAVACSLSWSAFAAPDMRGNLNLPAGTLVSALKALATQSDVELVYQPEQLKDIRTDGVQGSYSPQEAVSILLKGTGLRVYTAESGAMVIAPLAADTDAAQLEGRLHLAQESSVSPGDASSAASAEAPEPNAVLEEVVVTAQKREEPLDKVPISITVLSGAELDRSSASGAYEALNRVAGVSILPSGEAGGGATIAVRGVRAAQPIFGGSTTVGYYIDAVPFGMVKSAIVPDSPIYDLERIEVLKGPQGTLYGASSINGVVRILTKDPDLDAFDFKARASALTMENGDPGARGDLAVNVPLIEGKLAARAVLGYNHIGGWIDRRGNLRANDVDSRNIRLKVSAQLNESFSASVLAWSSRNDAGSPNTSGLNADRSIYLDLERNATEFDVYGLNLNYDFAGFTASSHTSYLNYRNNGQYDLGFDLSPGVPVTVFSNITSNILTQEILLNSTGQGPWVWSSGAFYRDAQDRPYQDIFPTGCCLNAPFDYYDTSKSFTLFGELTRKLLGDRLELTTGLRYFRDDVAQNENISGTGDPTVPLAEVERNFGAWTPRVVITSHLNDRHTLYASYSEGFRSGFDQDAVVLVDNPGIPPARSDKLHNYEVGAKGALLSGRLHYEAALYYLQWKGVQQQLIVPFGTLQVAAVINGAAKNGPGVDLALTARPTRNLEFGAAFNYNKLKLTEDVFSGGVLRFAKGGHSDVTGSMFGDYVFALGGTGFEGHLDASANYTMMKSNAQADGALFGDGLEDIIIARAGFAVRAPTHWEVRLFADNLFDQRAVLQPFGNFERVIRATPRTIGVQVEYRFK